MCLTFVVCVTQKRAASGQDASIPFSRIQPHPSTRGRSEDWVTQTQDLRLESPSLSCSGFNTPVSQPGEVRIDEVMVDEDMVRSPALIPPSRGFITFGVDTARGRECHAYIPPSIFHRPPSSATITLPMSSGEPVHAVHHAPSVSEPKSPPDTAHPHPERHALSSTTLPSSFV